jgi:pyruvate formate lyase activating enzyme
MEEEITARIFRIESLNTHNGPGYRTIIYFKGCPLRCSWCHNPEGISPKKEIWITKSKCIACEGCIMVCPVNALSMGETGIEVNRDLCFGCQICADICPSKAIEKLGEDYTVEKLFRKIAADIPFFETSGGGVTLTGGEPATSPGFVKEFLKKCREAGIHTAFDTSGFVSGKVIAELLPFIDLIFFDLKILDDEMARQHTGQGTSEILGALSVVREYIVNHKTPELQFRTPVIPGSTDSAANLEEIALFIKKEFEGIYSGWELCMFNDVCEDKYLKMNMDWKYSGLKFSREDYDKLHQFRVENGSENIIISGFFSK